MPHKIFKAIGAYAARVAGGGNAAGQAVQVRRDAGGIPGKMHMVINQSREHVMSGAVNDLPDISRVDPPVLRRLRNAAVDNENVGYAVYVISTKI